MTTATLVASEKVAVIDCPCTKRNCPRHGACDECREYRRNAKRPRAPFCEREPNWWQKLFRTGPASRR